MFKMNIPKEYAQDRDFVILPTRIYKLLTRSNRFDIPKKLERNVFTKRPIALVKKELTTVYPDDPQLVNDIVNGLKDSSVYAKR